MRNCTFRFVSGKHVCENCGCTVTAPESQRIVASCNADEGPGAELHAILRRLGFSANGDCKCRSRASLMDKNGCDWCETNIDEIVGWLRESAAERGLPFVDMAGRLLVKRAIANARRKAAANAQRPSHHDRGEEVAPPVHQTEG